MVQFLLCLSMQTVIMFCYYRSTLVNLQFFFSGITKTGHLTGLCNVQVLCSVQYLYMYTAHCTGIQCSVYTVQVEYSL